MGSRDRKEAEEIRLVVDANVLFSVLIKKGKTEEIFFENCLKLFAPELIFVEFLKYRDRILDKTERTSSDFYELVNILRKKIALVSNNEFEKYFARAEKISPDKKDVAYLALAMKLGCAIWSQDKALKSKQKNVKIYSTEDLIRFI